MVSEKQPFGIRCSVDMVTIPTFVHNCIKVSYTTNVAYQLILLYYIILYYITLHYITLKYIILYIIFYYIILRCVAFRYIILYYIILYYIIYTFMLPYLFSSMHCHGLFKANP
jgi:hypothetical protein